MYLAQFMDFRDICLFFFLFSSLINKKIPFLVFMIPWLCRRDSCPSRFGGHRKRTIIVGTIDLEDIEKELSLWGQSQ